MHTDEDGYVFAVRKNALQILLPRYGLETTLFLRDKEGKSVGEFNEEVIFLFLNLKRLKKYVRKQHRQLIIIPYICSIR